MIELFRVVVDFGLVILIWMVQLIIYPSFIFYQQNDLAKWHSVYTGKITILVAPLMFAQTGLIGYQVLNELSVFIVSSAVICATLWLLTFFEAVPLHQKIDEQVDVKSTCEKLVQINKKRTALWTILFFISLADYWY
mgnify:FL=1